MMIIIMHLTLCQFIIYESLHVTLMSQPLLYFFSFSLVEGIVNVSMLPMLPMLIFFCGCNLNSVHRNLLGYLVFCSVFQVIC